MKNMLKLGIVLALYATAACVGLAFVYTGTSEVIKQRQQADLEASLAELFPGMDGFTDITNKVPSPSSGGISFQIVYEIKKGNTLMGLAVQGSGPSYGGPIKVLTGIDSAGKVTRVKILEHSDTPGLGANAASPTYYVNKSEKITFTGQFSGKHASHPFEVKKDVIAITASTITSRGVAALVKAAGDAALRYMEANK